MGGGGKRNRNWKQVNTKASKRQPSEGVVEMGGKASKLKWARKVKTTSTKWGKKGELGVSQ